MKNNNNSTSGGAGFLSILTVLFIGLKLTGFITWSWWWVFAPMWAPIVIFSTVAVMMAIHSALTK
jgi:uncharacterized protein (DUF983 family)